MNKIRKDKQVQPGSLMKAIILAGGEGTRLQPVSTGIPKPMTKVLDTPLLERTVSLLKRYNITEICMTLRFLPQMIMDYFGDGSDFGVHIQYRIEEEPLGTAGGVKACKDFIGKSDFIIVSGDAALDAELSELFDYHHEHSSLVTIALAKRDNPYEYGIVLSDNFGKVTGFVEKPSHDRVFSDLVNTGIYIMSPEVLEYIPTGETYDFAKDLFPALLENSLPIYATELNGYWLDIGSCSAYLKANTDALTMSGQMSYIADSATVEPESQIGSLAIIGAGSVIRFGTKIRNSVVDCAEIGARCDIRGTIICKGAKIGSDCKIQRGCVIGENAVIGSGCYIADGIRIFPGCIIPDGTRVCEHVTTSKYSARMFELNSNSEIIAQLSAEQLLTLGARIASISPRIGFAGNNAELIAAGAYRFGAKVYMLDANNAAVAAFAGRAYKFPITVYADFNSIRLTDAFGLPIAPDNERKLNCEPKPIIAVNADKQYISGTEELYRVTLGNLPEHFTLSEDGLRVTLTDENGVVHEWDKLLAALVLAECEYGCKTVALPYDAPAICEQIAAGKGSVLRLMRDEPRARAYFSENPHTLDGTALAVRLSELVNPYGSYAELMSKLPDYKINSREMKLDNIATGRIMRKLAASYPKSQSIEFVSGVRLDLGNGSSARVIPNSGILRVLAEANSMEAASDICSELSNKLMAIMNERK